MDLPVISFSNSELKTYERCPKQWEYKYLQDLVPKEKQRPLYLGNWIHSALETHYRDGDWRIGHQLYVDNWNKLFEEERIMLRRPKKGRPTTPPLPEMVERIMKSYLWYYKNEGWRVVLTEQKIEVHIPVKGGGFYLFKGIVDLVVEDEEGLYWVIDHKTASTIPDPTSFHAMDPQLMLYPWAIEKQLGLKIAGVIYNYVKSKAPSVPKLTKAGAVSRSKITTDYPTLARFFRSNGLDPADYSEVLRPLRRKSPFLRRYRLPREAFVTREILLDAITVVKRIHTPQRYFRVITRDCARMCSYHDICRSELNGMDTADMRKRNFNIRAEVEAALGRGSYADADPEDDEEGDD